ncbi:hypothetical protein KGF56_003079 [Candida oxycetoniae]|uniref:Sec39 domain-containing protein n=1 Tax=Candida oxycetoniae TaxID=497107 RepID=A0AAI9SWJ1_9ASCO|nr:uncharacterized protein KGF56_003079 [Candida oxycetoniae]KAI3404179.2 hypothetical protein KGF56_003079 [Candida oxycetoniae]
MEEQRSKRPLERSLDASLYVSLVQVLSSSLSQDYEQLLSQLRIVKARLINFRPYYVTKANLLNTLLVYTYPETIPYSLVSEIAEFILSEIEIVEAEDATYPFQSIENETSLIQTADDLLIDTNSKSQALGFEYDESIDANMNLLRFIQAKTFDLSRSYRDLNEISGLFENVDFKEFRLWQQGVIEPYKYYWTHFGSIYQSESISSHAYLKSHSLQEHFDILVHPIDSDQVHSVKSWFQYTILPILSHYDFDLEPLESWMFTKYHGSVQQKFELWNIGIKMLANQLGISKIQNIVEKYLVMCYYNAFILQASAISSVDLTKLYDIISETLSAIVCDDTAVEPPSLQFDWQSSITAATFDEFSSIHNPLHPLFQIKYTAFLRDAIATCQRLFPISKLTLDKYLELKFNSNDSSLQKEVSKITCNINASNSQQLIQMVEVFQKVFVPRGKKANVVNYILLERLLTANLFDQVTLLLKDGGFDLSTKEIYELVMEKFWESFNQATNINDKIGHLHQSRKCLDLVENQNPTQSDLSEANRKEIVKLKHLFKAMSAMKNFKIVVEKNKPFTPSQLIKFSGQITNNQIDEKNCFHLITIILEQNAKSYLAFEKLFRILNDLLLYFDNLDLVESNFYFNKLKSACIESALVDNNFSFAYDQSIELFEHFAATTNIDEFWLTFYQVGKFVSPDWLESDESDILGIWIKQRQILSLTLQRINCGDHVTIVLDQWNNLNRQIEKHCSEKEVYQAKTSYDYEPQAQQPITSITQGLITDATKRSNNASEKISNLFVSGLGWAIGATKQ